MTMTEFIKTEIILYFLDTNVWPYCYDKCKKNSFWSFCEKNKSNDFLDFFLLIIC